MASFTMPKSYSEIEKGIALSEGIYRMRSVAPPVFEPNKAGDGVNLVVEVAIFGEADPKANGRTFKKWFGMPKPADADRTTRRGQPMLDFKMEMIGRVVQALGGEVSGAEVVVPEQFECRWAVIQKLNQESQEIENDLDGDPLPV